MTTIIRRRSLRKPPAPLSSLPVPSGHLIARTFRENSEYNEAVQNALLGVLLEIHPEYTQVCIELGFQVPTGIVDPTLKRVRRLRR